MSESKTVIPDYIYILCHVVIDLIRNLFFKSRSGRHACNHGKSGTIRMWTFLLVACLHFHNVIVQFPFEGRSVNYRCHINLSSRTVKWKYVSCLHIKYLKHLNTVRRTTREEQPFKGSGFVMTRLYKDWCWKLELFCDVLTLQTLITSKMVFPGSIVISRFSRDLGFFRIWACSYMVIN